MKIETIISRREDNLLLEMVKESNDILKNGNVSR